MQAGFRPGEGYFEDIADLIALAAKILYSRVLNWIKHFTQKKLNICSQILSIPQSSETKFWLYPKI